MTPAQIESVQKAWSRISALNDAHVKEIYEELFRQAPELIGMFPHHNLPIAKMSDTLNTVITSLEQLDSLGFIIRDLGRRHQRYNVQPEHFESLKRALTTVFERRLGTQYQPDLGEAWSQMYDEVSALMLEGLNRGTDSSPQPY